MSGPLESTVLAPTRSVVFSWGTILKRMDSGLRAVVVAIQLGYIDISRADERVLVTVRLMIRM